MSDFDVIREALDKHHLNTTGVSRSYNPTQTYKDNEEAAAALAALDALVAERDEARQERDKALLSVEGLSKRLTIAVAAEARVTELEAALGAVKAWLDQEEEVGLGVPDILWDIILAAAPTKEGT